MRSLLLACTGLALASSVTWIACSNSGNGGGGGGSSSGASSSGSSSGTVTDGGAFALGVPCSDSDPAVYGDPGTLPPNKGDIIKCAKDADLSASDLSARLAAAIDTSTDPAPATNLNYSGKPLTSGAHVYRILYRTERGDAPGGDASVGSPGYSSALVLIPTVPRASGAMPLLVGARGSRGQAPACTASQEQDAGWIVNGDYESLSLPMVGLGYPIIIPDLAGYANYGAPGNPPSAYAEARDIGKSTLDGARALMKMFPGSFNGKVGIIGHSQGGFSAFASVALAPTYAPELNLGAVVGFSPLWISQATWGALLYEASYYPIGGPIADPTPTAVSIWYHYTEGELLDGPGHGGDVFAPSQRAVVKHFVDNDCWYSGWNGTGPLADWDASTAYPDLQAAGQLATDFFDPFFANAIAQPAAYGTATHPCGDDDAGITCQRWINRYADDRPHLVNPPPILIMYGGNDQTIDPTRMACVIERLRQDNNPFTLCIDPLYGHTSMLRAHADYAADWFGSKLLGEAAPAACAVTTLEDDAGAPYACATPPPNN